MLQPSFQWKSGGAILLIIRCLQIPEQKSPNLNHLRLGERVEKIIKYEQYQLNRGLNVEFDFIQPSLNTEAGTGLVDVREITMT